MQSTCVLLLASGFAFETWLNFRQLAKLKSKKPETVSSFCSDEKYKKAQVYGAKKIRFSIYQSAFSLLENIVFLFNISTIWNLSYGETEVTKTLCFLAIYVFGSTIINLPFQLYSTFVVEKEFNQQTIGLFFTDLAKKMALICVIGGPLVVVVIKIIRWSGSTFYFNLWMFMVVFQLILIHIFPIYIQPLFDTFTPLKEGELRNRITKLCNDLKFPMSQMFVVDGSKRSGHSNAYFFGLVNKRIVIFDTLLQQATTDEIVAIIGHELGHWKKNHMLMNMAASFTHLFLIFYFASEFIFNSAIYNAFGLQESPVLLGLLIFQFVYYPVELFVGFALNVMSRRNEFEADKFSCDLGFGEQLMNGLIKIHLENLGNLNPDYLYSTMNYSHPPLIERLEAIKKTQ